MRTLDSSLPLYEILRELRDADEWSWIDDDGETIIRVSP